MISFLLEEGVITVGTLSGIFTTALLNSFKLNIVDPGINAIVPPHKLDVKENVNVNVEGEKSEKSGFSDLFPLPVGTNPNASGTIKWQTFLKDLITWIIIMFMLYLFWKNVLHPAKLSKMGKNFNLN